MRLNSALVLPQKMDSIDLRDRGEMDPNAGVTYAWRDLNVYAGGGNMIRKKPKVHILKNGEYERTSCLVLYLTT